MSELDPKSRKSWELIEKLVLENNRNQRRQQRWAIFFKLLFAAYTALVLWLFWPAGTHAPSVEDGPVVAQVAINGVIAASKPANADAIIDGLEDAFAADGKIVMLKINSPGGSPVQAGQVYRAINYLKEQHPDKKVVAVITDMGASGAYYIAAAADEIYADRASIVGSIGVIMKSFGFTKALHKLGVQRRVMTAGDNKAILDPFQPMTDEQKQYIQQMLDVIHQQFITAVKEGRGDRLKVKGHPELFSGLFWTGEKALKLGLIDGLGSPRTVARQLTGGEHIVDFTVRPNPMAGLLKRFGASIGQSVTQAVGLGARDTDFSIR